MRFLIDESADARLVAHLIALGHDAIFVAFSHGQGLSDVQVLDVAHAQRRVLITDDPDFGELVFRQRQLHAGVIFFRLKSSLLAVRIARLDDVLRAHADELDQFIVVQERGTRVRRR